MSDCDTELFDKLRTLRKELADQQGVPPYVVFGDATLVEMASMLPNDAESFLAVNGVGERKLDRYGGAFLDLIADHIVAK